MGDSTKQARQAVVAARAALATEADELVAAGRSAVDIPAKVRNHPIETAGLAGGAVFLAAGGPKRILRAVGKAGRGGKEPPPKTLLPKDVQKVIDGLGDDVQAEELNEVQDGKRYGWPYVYDDDQVNPHTEPPPPATSSSSSSAPAAMTIRCPTWRPAFRRASARMPPRPWT